MIPKTVYEIWKQKTGRSYQELNRLLGIGDFRGVHSGWKKIPAKHVIKLEYLTGIPRNTMRPDVFYEYP